VLPSPEQGRSIANALLGLLVASFFVALFNHGLVPSMEPRFAEVVREMIAANEYLIPLKTLRRISHFLLLAGDSREICRIANDGRDTLADVRGIFWLAVRVGSLVAAIANALSPLGSPTYCSCASHRVVSILYRTDG